MPKVETENEVRMDSQPQSLSPLAGLSPLLAAHMVGVQTMAKYLVERSKAIPAIAEALENGFDVSVDNEKTSDHEYLVDVILTSTRWSTQLTLRVDTVNNTAQLVESEERIPSEGFAIKAGNTAGTQD